VSLWNTEHLLQTAAWGQMQTRFGWRAETVSGALILFRPLVMGWTRAYVPRGPLLDWADAAATQETFAALEAAGRRQRAIALTVEPDLPDSPEHAAQLAGLGFRPAEAVQPRRSLIINLRGSEAELLARMKQKTRYNIRLAAKKDVTIRAASMRAAARGDLETFGGLMSATSARDHFHAHPAAYYRAAYESFHHLNQCELFVAEYNGAPLAGVMAFALGKRAWYFYGASSDTERPRMAPYAAQWAAIRWAKARGAEEYDLWGVPDEDEATLEAQFESRADGLWGVYRFKRGWGGQLVRSVGAWEKVFNPLVHRAYRLFLGLRRRTSPPGPLS
jgi:lipid II:glycine glycyltransferase (peptidoglycan interpeptide bridge formation enzyme)